MNKFTYACCVIVCNTLVACSGSDNNNDNAVELISTSTLEDSGINAEVPILSPSRTIDLVAQGAVGLSPNGKEVAIAKSYPLDPDLITGYETTITIYDTATGLLQREFTQSFEGEGLTDNRQGGGFSRPELVMWSDDNTLTVLFGGAMVGYSIQALTGEVLATQTDTDIDLCIVYSENIDTFDPGSNSFFCLGYYPDNKLITVDTRSLTYIETTPKVTDEYIADMAMSYDANEFALAYECVNCSQFSTEFFNSQMAQSTGRDNTSTRFTVLGDGFNVIGIERNSFLINDTSLVSLDGHVDTSANVSLMRNIVAMDRAFYPSVTNPYAGFRLLEIPNGRVVGDILHKGVINGSITFEEILFSSDGSLAARVSANSVDIYSTNQPTNYTALKECVSDEEATLINPTVLSAYQVDFCE
jgi:hypothetical protein